MPLKQQKSLFDPVICKTPDAQLQHELPCWTCVVYGRGVFRGGQPNRPLSGFYTKKVGFVGTVLSTRSVLWTSYMPKMRWRPGLRPWPRWASSRRSPDSLVGWAGGHPFPNPHNSRRLCRLDSRSASVAPNVKCKIKICAILAYFYLNLVAMATLYAPLKF